MHKKAWNRPFAAGLTILLTAACAQENTPQASVENEGETPASHIVYEDSFDRARAAVAERVRPEADWADDEMRKPASVLAFIDIQPGMTVFEIEAGRGYYTELFSMLTGPEGTVFMQNPESFDGFLGDAVAARLADDRLPNVQLTKTNFDNLEAQTGSVDIATWLLGPHELYFTPSDGMSLGDAEQAYAEVFRILKPGGSFVILDHAAEPGAPETTGGALHRIDSAIVKSLAEAAGFEFVEESDILRNENDDYSMAVFDPAVRRKTDRFLLKYKKPAE